MITECVSLWRAMPRPALLGLLLFLITRLGRPATPSSSDTGANAAVPDEPAYVHDVS